jgi:hypothetical protein
MMAILGLRRCVFGAGASGERILSMKNCNREYNQTMGWNPELFEHMVGKTSARRMIGGRSE